MVAVGAPGFVHQSPPSLEGCTVAVLWCSVGLVSDNVGLDVHQQFARQLVQTAPHLPSDTVVKRQ